MPNMTHFHLLSWFLSSILKDIFFPLIEQRKPGQIHGVKVWKQVINYNFDDLFLTFRSTKHFIHQLDCPPFFHHGWMDGRMDGWMDGLYFCLYSVWISHGRWNLFTRERLQCYRMDFNGSVGLRVCLTPKTRCLLRPGQNIIHLHLVTGPFKCGELWTTLLSVSVCSHVWKATRTNAFCI